MVFESEQIKSDLERLVEDAAGKSVARLDAVGRGLRVQAAMILEIAAAGYSNAQVAAVAKRAEVSTATIYRDFGNRNALMLAALEWFIELVAQHWVIRTSYTDPVKRLEALFLSYGTALNDPFLAWIIRLYIVQANTAAPHLLAMGHAIRKANQSFWEQEIASLEAQGHLVPTHNAIVVALMIEAIERRTILARLAFGENDDRGPALGDVAEHMALAVFRVFGTKAFWEHRDDKPAPGWLNDAAATHGLEIKAPVAVLDLPSKRLGEYANRILARDVNRLDGEARKNRIQLAALVECMEVGYEAATLSSVASRAGVSTATFYSDYTDKRDLFIDAIKLQARFLVDFNSLIDPELATAETMATLLFSISTLLADPDFLWMHRIAMTSDISDAPDLIQSSRDTRVHNEGFWSQYLESLEAKGSFIANERSLTVNILLGATQRRSILSMIIFGVDDKINGDLLTLTRASVDFVLRLVGAPAED
jgi:AcrR family transcriptional regulator